MKRILLFTLLLSFIGYSQKTIQPNPSVFKDKLSDQIPERIDNPLSMRHDLEQKSRLRDRPLSLEVKMKLDSITKSKNRFLDKSNRISDSKQSQRDKKPFEGFNEFDGKINRQKTPNSFSLQNEIFSEEDITLRRDSVHYEKDYKINWFYNSNGNVSSEFQYNWNSEIESYVPYTKKEYYYDSNGEESSRVEYYWNFTTDSFELKYLSNSSRYLGVYGWGDETTGYFIPYNKTEILYDNLGNKIEESFYLWSDETNSFYYDYKMEWTIHSNGNTNQVIQILYNPDETSSTSYPDWKEEYTYDENGNQTLYINYNWSSESQSFIPSRKYEYTYDDSGRSTEILQYYHVNYYYLYGKYEYSYDNNSNLKTRIKYNITSYTDGTSQSEPSEKIEWTFGNFENVILKIVYRFNTDSQSFIPEEKEEYTYDENGNETLEIRHFWSSESQSFIPDRKKEYNYDENGNQTLYINYNWSSESQSFIPSRKDEYSYDENGNETLYIFYYWDSESQSFIPDSKQEKTYYEGLRSMRTNYYWDIESQSYIITYKYGREYNSNGDITLIVDYYLDDNNDYVVNNYFEECIYDNENKLVQKFEYDWDSISKSFIVVEKINYNYLDKFDSYWWYGESEKLDKDIGVFKPNRKWEISVEFEDENNLTVLRKYFDYDTDFNRWEEPDDYFMYYTKTQSLSTNSVEPNLFSIYPNPTSNKLLINSSESLSNPIFELYDVKGSKILSNPFKLTEPIDVSDLQPSMYIYNVKDGSELKQSGKVLIE